MSNDFFESSGVPVDGQSGDASPILGEFEEIEAGFDKLPALSGNGSKIVRVNAGATALEAVDAGEILGSSVGFTGDLTPSQITSNQDDYSPTDLATAAVLRLSTDASRNITGIAGGADGRLLLLHNIGSFNIVLKNETTSTAANRFSLVADRTILPKEAVLIQYDLTSLRWRMVGPQFTTFFQTLLDDADAATVLATLGALPLAGGTMTGDITMTGASIIEAEGAAVTAASSTDIWATDGNTVHVTGNTGIADFATAPQAGAWMKVIFDGTPVLTQSANLNLNAGGANITIAAGDMAFVYADTTTQMDVFVIRKSGAMPVVGTAGQIWRTNSGATDGAWSDATIQSAVITTTGAATVDSGEIIPSWATEVIITYSAISSNGTSNYMVQLGDAGGIETAGYASSCFGNATSSSSTAGILIANSVSSSANFTGVLRLHRHNAAAFTWIASGTGHRDDLAAPFTTSGIKSTSAAMTQIRMTTVGGSDTFDAMSMTVSYR